VSMKKDSHVSASPFETKEKFLELLTGVGVVADPPRCAPSHLPALTLRQIDFDGNLLDLLWLTLDT